MPEVEPRLIQVCRSRYNGASNPSSATVGAAAEFQKDAPFATYYHCMMHTFNLCASQSVNVTYVRNCLDKVRELTSFFNTNAKRHLLLDTIILLSADTDTFKQLCTTRFIERRRHYYSTGSFISSTAGFAENYNMGVQRCHVKCS